MAKDIDHMLTSKLVTEAPSNHTEPIKVPNANIDSYAVIARVKLQFQPLKKHDIRIFPYL